MKQARGIWHARVGVLLEQKWLYTTNCGYTLTHNYYSKLIRNAIMSTLDKLIVLDKPLETPVS